MLCFQCFCNRMIEKNCENTPFSASRAPKRCVLQRFFGFGHKKRCKTQHFGALDAEIAVFSYFFQPFDTKNIENTALFTVFIDFQFFFVFSFSPWFPPSYPHKRNQFVIRHKRIPFVIRHTRNPFVARHKRNQCVSRHKRIPFVTRHIGNPFVFRHKKD